MIKMNLSAFGHKINILGVYEVYDDSTVAVKDHFFQEIDEEIDMVGFGREIIVLGDLNGRAGPLVKSKIVGPFRRDCN